MAERGVSQFKNVRGHWSITLTDYQSAPSKNKDFVLEQLEATLDAILKNGDISSLSAKEIRDLVDERVKDKAKAMKEAANPQPKLIIKNNEERAKKKLKVTTERGIVDVNALGAPASAVDDPIAYEEEEEEEKRVFAEPTTGI
jgi:hypothetical protein